MRGCNRRWELRVGLTTWSALFLFSIGLSVEAEASPGLSEAYYQAWIERAAPLLDQSEREAFAGLETEAERERFIERFWARKGRAWEQWVSRDREARRRFPRQGDPRVEVFRLLGPFSESHLVDCRPLKALEIWRYATAASPKPTYVVFTMADSENQTGVALWSEELGKAQLFFDPNGPPAFGTVVESLDRVGGAERDLSECQNPELLALLEQAVESALGWDELRSRMSIRLEEGPAGTSTAAPSAQGSRLGAAPWAAPGAAPGVPGTVVVRFAGRSAQAMGNSVQALVRLELEADRLSLWRDPSGHSVELPKDLAVWGEIVPESGTVTPFVYRATVLSAPPTGGVLSLSFLRRLPSGQHRLVLRLVAHGRAFREVVDVTVPSAREVSGEGLTALAEALGSADFASTVVLEEDRPKLIDRGSGLQIRPIPPRLQVLRLAVGAIVWGREIERVRWLLDGEEVATSAEAPFEAELDLGIELRPRRLRAEGLDEAGEVVAHDELLFNDGSHRFKARLVEPRSGGSYSGTLPVRVAVDLPVASTLGRIELFLNDQLEAVLSRPPFELGLDLPESEEIGHLRVVAHLEDGRTASDDALFNTPDFGEELEVDLVEVFFTARNRFGRTISDLERDEVKLREEGSQVELRRFERIDNVPIHVAVLMDGSSSMRRSIDELTQVALGFFDAVLREGDQAALATFNHATELVVPFTGDRELLASRATEVRASGGTALFNSMVLTLYYFGGLEGKRAMVVLSDGKDEHSTVSFDQVAEYARRSQVAIYSIGLMPPSSVDRTEIERARQRLKRMSRLARTTGGRGYVASGLTDVPGIYRDIENDLRSQYLATYQSPGSGEDFREIEVRVTRGGAKVSAPSGYFPD